MLGFPFWAWALVVALVSFLAARGLNNTNTFRDGAGMVGVFIGIASVIVAALICTVCMVLPAAYATIPLLMAIGAFGFGVTLLFE